MSWRDEGKPHYFLFVDEEYKAQRGKVAAQGPTVVHQNPSGDSGEFLIILENGWSKRTPKL